MNNKRIYIYTRKADHIFKKTLACENRVVMGVQSERKRWHVKPCLYHIFQGSFHEGQENQYQHYQGEIWYNHEYSWTKAPQKNYSTTIYISPILLQILGVTKWPHGVKGRRSIQHTTINDYFRNNWVLMDWKIFNAPYHIVSWTLSNKW